MKIGARKLLALVLALVMIFSVLSITAFAADLGKDTYDEDGWVGAWSTSMVKGEISISKGITISLLDVTARTRMSMTRQGDVIRLRLSNENGTSPLNVGEVTVAIGDSTCARGIKLDTMKKATYGGQTSFEIPAGQAIYTDPVKISFDACTDLVVSMFFKGINEFSTVGLIGGHSYVTVGNQTEKQVSAASIDLSVENIDVGAYEILPVLSNVDVYDEDGYSVVLFGDSTLTNTIPQKLAALAKANGINNVGILQQAIKGNEVLRDGQGIIGEIMGKAGKARFMNDALNQPGVKMIVIKEGVNDLVHPACKSKVDLYPDGFQYDELIAGYMEMINAVKSHNAATGDDVKIVFVTRSPANHYTRNLFGIMGDDITWTQELYDYRAMINNQIKEWAATGVIDDYINFDVMSDAANGGIDPEAMYAPYTLDGAHLTDLGCQRAALEFYPHIFGENKVGSDSSLFECTAPHGGIDGEIASVMDMLGIESKLDLKGLLSKLDLSKFKDILNTVKKVKNIDLSDMSSILDVIGIDAGAAKTGLASKLLELVKCNKVISVADVEKAFSSQNLDAGKVIEEAKELAVSNNAFEEATVDIIAIVEADSTENVIDKTPLAGISQMETENEAIMNTGDDSCGIFAIITAVSAIAFVLSRKKFVK